MGIEGLLQVLKPATVKTHISQFAKKTAAIDASSWLYKGAYSCTWQLSQGVKTNDYLNFIFSMIKLLRKNLVTPLFVFDGPTLPLKSKTAEKRQQDKQANKKMAEDHLKKGDEEEAKVMYSRCIFISSEMKFTLMDLLDYMDIKYIVAPYEADVQLAYCCAKGLADFVITEDSDLLVYGCENVVLKLDHEGNCENITLKKTLSDQGLVRSINNNYITGIAELTHEKFVELCILGGCDYLKNIQGIGLKRAMKFINEGTIEQILEEINARSAYRGKIPEDYLEMVKLIKLQFFYGWVIDPTTMKMVRLNPVEEGTEIKGLGDKIDDAILSDYAKGLYDIKKGKKRKRLTKEELIRIILELEENKRDKKIVTIKSEPATSFRDIQLIQTECVVEFNEEIKRIVVNRNELDESESDIQRIQFIRPRKRKAREVIESDDRAIGGVNIKSETNPLKPADSKDSEDKAEEVRAARFKYFKVNEEEKIKEEKKEEKEEDKKEEKKRSSEETIIINDEQMLDEAILISDEEALEDSMERMNDIVVKGVKELDKFYE